MVAISFMYLKSDKGISVLSQNLISPNTGIADTGKQFIYNIDFAALGFDMNKDILEGQLTFQLNSSMEELVKLSKVASQPLHPAERKFFGLDR